MDSYIKPLLRAVPYIRLYKGKVFVVKVGGSVLRKPHTLEGIAADVGALHQLGVKVVLVHGGGPQATELARRLGHEPQIVAGRRVTSDSDLDVAKMVYAGKINLELIASLGAVGLRAVGLSGSDGEFLKARRRPRSAPPGGTELVDWGHVGDVTEVDARLMRLLLEGDYVPAICSLASDGQGGVLNVNADSVAAHVAVSLSADKLLMLTDTSGILDDAKDPDSVLSTVTPADVEARRSAGKIFGGMLPKVDACLLALRGGVRRTHILDGTKPHALLEEVFTNEGCGTMILGPEESRRYESEVEAAQEDEEEQPGGAPRIDPS